MLRNNVHDETPLGKEAQKFMKAGKLVPDYVILNMMKDRLLRPALVGVSKKSQKNKNVNKEDEKDKQNQ